ncbi:hypothetical protein EYF80_028376 [Liparis tanakae]|uniref:Uncharacterized protein n=1 Tax=Liparis tanakae TaxID=230148 RepID=A0A4Z2H6C1_9TELE|nr:hypothetical protein EYF80_028376 [Liparis tanakae]
MAIHQTGVKEKFFRPADLYFHEHRKNTVRALLAVFILPLLKRHFETPRGGAAGFSHSSFDPPPKPASYLELIVGSGVARMKRERAASALRRVWIRLSSASSARSEQAFVDNTPRAAVPPGWETGRQAQDAVGRHIVGGDEDEIGSLYAD